jgi:tetratricopeptide (TPR) repeat protein
LGSFILHLGVYGLRRLSLVFAFIVGGVQCDVTRARAADKDTWRHCMQTAAPGLSIKACSAIIDANKELPENAALAYYYRGKAYADCKQDGPAQRDYLTALKNDDQLAHAHLDLARLFVSEKNWPAADAEFSKAAASDGEDAKLAGFRFDALTERGNTRLEEKRIADALSDYAQVLSECSGCSGTFRNRARLFRSERRFGEAAADINQSLAINMRADSTLNQRGLLYLKMGNLQQAILNYTEAIRLNPNNESAYKNRADAFAKLGRPRDAQADRATAAAVEAKQAAKKKLICERTEPESDSAAGKGEDADKDGAGKPADASRLDDKALAELFTGKKWAAVQGIWSVEMEFRADGSFVQRSKDLSQGGTPVAVIAGMWAATDDMLCIYTNQGLCMTGREDKGAISLRRKDGTLEYAGVVSALKAIDVSNATVPIAEFPLDEKFLPGTQTAAATGKTLLYFIGGFDGANRPARIHGVVQRYFVAQMQKTQGWDVIDADYPFTYNSQYRSSEAATYGVAAYLQRRIKELKAQGYERIFVGGQSFGSWVSLIVSTERNMPIDATILLVPACCGYRLSNETEAPRMLDFGHNKLFFDQLAQRILYPTVAIFFDQDEFEPADRGQGLIETLTQKGVANLVIDHPPNFRGHGSGWQPLFDFTFRDCIVAFLKAPKTTQCDTRPPADDDFRSIFSIKQIPDWEAKKVPPSELIGEEFLIYPTGNLAKIVSEDRTEMKGYALGDRFNATAFRDGKYCVRPRALYQQPIDTDEVCRTLVQFAPGQLLSVDEPTGKVERWWIEQTPVKSISAESGDK